MDMGAFIFPVFSPDGKSIYYSGFINSRDFGIWRIDAAGADKPVEIIRTGTAIPREISISRDGKRLTYTSSQQISQLWSLPLDAGHKPKEEPKPLYSDTVYRTSYPVFSPDGSRLAFFARVFGGHGDIWTMNSDGTGAAPLTNSTTTDLLPSWTPDGQSIVYTRHSGDALHPWRISVNDRSERPLMASNTIQGWPQLSRDGREVVWHDTRPGTMNIWTTDVSTGKSKQLTRDAEGAGYPVWSPDSQSIAYQLARGEHSYLAVMNRDGSEPKQLLSAPGRNWAFSWSPDNRKIVYAAFRAGEWKLHWLERATGIEQELTSETSIARYVRYPSWSPDGKRIVYEMGQTRGNIFVVNLSN
jgi:Tol biopolymer transport system component